MKERRLIESSPIEVVLNDIFAEVVSATEKWPPFNSAHEGYAIILEELDELKEHVWMNQRRRDIEAMKREAVQVAAMAVRFAVEICNESKGRK